MLRTGVLVFMLTTTLAYEEFFNKYAFTKVMMNCFGSNTYYNFLSRIAEAQRRCDREPMTPLLAAGFPPYSSYATQYSLLTPKREGRFIPFFMGTDTDSVKPSSSSPLPHLKPSLHINSQGYESPELQFGIPDIVSFEINLDETDLATTQEESKPVSFSSQPGLLKPLGTFIGQAGRPNPFAGQSGSPNLFAGQIGSPNPFATQSGSPNLFAGQSGSPNPFASQLGRPNSFVGQSGSINPFTGQPDSPNLFIGHSGRPNNLGRPDLFISQSGQPDLHGIFNGQAGVNFGPYNPEAFYNVFNPFTNPANFNQGGRGRPLWDAGTLTEAYDKVNAGLSNMTCVLKSINAIDGDLNIKFDAFVSYYYSVPLDTHLKRDLINSVNFCRSFATCLPVERLEVSLPVELQRIMSFLKCEKKTRLASCFKHDLRNNLAHFDLSAFPVGSGRSNIVDKLMTVLVGADSADDMEFF